MNTLRANNSTTSSSGSDDESSGFDADDFQRFNSVASVVIPIVFGTITAVGIIGNSSVIGTILFNRRRRGRSQSQSGPPTSTTDILIANLALADLLFVVFCVPFSAVRFVVSAWPFGLFFCKIYQYGIYVNAYASVYTLVLMSADRYLAVVHPIRSMSWRSPRNACLAAFVVWIVALLSNAPLIGEIKILQGMSDNETYCEVARFFDEEDGGKFMRLFYGSFFAFAFLLPLTVTMILYGILLRRLLCEGMSAKHRSRAAKSTINGRKLSKPHGEGEESVHPVSTPNLEINKNTHDKHSRPSSGNNRQPASLKRSRKRQRVTQMVVIVVVTFASCWLPIQIIFLVQSFDYYPENVPAMAIKLASNCLAYMNSCLNPILYAFFSQHFRKGFKNLLCACLCCCFPVSLDNRDGLLRRAQTRNESQNFKSRGHNECAENLRLNRMKLEIKEEEQKNAEG